MLNFTISENKLSLLLNDRPCYPLDSPRYESWFLGKLSPWPTSFSAFQVQANISAHNLDLLYPPGHDRYGHPRGTSMGGFSLAYQHALFPARDANDILLLLRVIGIRDGYQDARVDLDFSAANQTEETVQIVLTKDEATGSLYITALELVSAVNSNGSTYMFGEELNSRVDLLAFEPHVTTFVPREWDYCGRKDDHLRQRFCSIELWWSDYWILIAIIVSSVIGGILVLASLFYLGWLLRKGQKRSAEYIENLQKIKDESERLIDASNTEHETQNYVQDKTHGLPEGDMMVVVVEGESKLGAADHLEVGRDLATSKPLPQIPLEVDPTFAQQMPSYHTVRSEIEEGLHREDGQFEPFVSNVGRLE